MFRKLYFTVLLLVHLFTFCASWILLDGNGYEYRDGDYIGISFKNDTSDITHKMFEKNIVVEPHSMITLQILDLPTDVSFVLAQAHAYKYNITLSKVYVLQPFLHVNGTNIGLIKQNTGMAPHNMNFFILNDNKVSVMVLVAFQPYSSLDPVPGGCNMEFPVEIAPFLQLTYNDAVVVMNMQSAAETGLDPHCDIFPPPVELEVYHMYLEERDFTSTAYFEALTKMMTVDGMQKFGTVVDELAEGSPLRRMHAAYPGTGSVYGVIARSPAGTAAAYVPALTYACGNHVTEWDDCEIFTAPLSEILCASMLFVGLLVCVCGHRKFSVGSSLFCFLWGSVITCIALGNTYGSGYGISLLGVLAGILFALVWYFFLWPFFGVPIIAALASTLALGFLLASSIMYAGLGSASWLTYDFSFWSLFVSITATVPVLFMFAMHIGNVVACATIGAYVFIAPIDHYVGSNLKFIFENSLRRATNRDFRLAAIDPPFELTDLLLILTWFLLAVSGTAMQLYLQRGRPPFPPRSAWCCGLMGTGATASSPSPAATTTTTQPRRSLLQRAAIMGSAVRRPGGGPASAEAPGTERTPLLVDVRIPDSDAHSPDSVFDSPARPPPPEALYAALYAGAPPSPSAPSAPAAPAAHSTTREYASNPEKLASKLLAVLEPNEK